MNELIRAAAPASLLEIDGKQYRLSALTIGDLAEFARWAADEAVRLTESRIAVLERNGACTAETKTEMLRQTFEDIDSGAAESRQTVTFDGVAMMGWLALRKLQPELTPDAVKQLVGIATMKSFQRELDKASGLDDPNPRAPATTGATS